MKKRIGVFLILFLCILFTGCKSIGNQGSSSSIGEDNLVEVKEMYVYINNNKLKVNLEDNSSAQALVELLGEGDITVSVNDYGDFEKYGPLGHSIVRNDTPTETTPGDVILYQGNNICFYYGNNSWNFTKLGRIEGYSENEYRELLGAGLGTIEVVLSLN